ncbi:hypothetical protein [Legionella nagasakiensis]|uniref:hypothetical protein n=1 Tax=Legionella nagasakiensis TaxID=535290 RepID=UPI0010569F50|nr:hypothetical protein [Legionella nagasakiensis]
MSRFIVLMLLALLFLPTQAADIPEAAVQAQQNDQELCVQQKIKQCIDKCQETEDINCTQLCKKNTKNECRQAGE